MVPKKGLEPPHPCGYMDLNHARLPIPPLRRVTSLRGLSECLEGRDYTIYSTSHRWGVKQRSMLYKPTILSGRRRCIVRKVTTEIKDEKPEKDQIAHIRTLSHDLSNSLEAILQAAYLLGQSRVDDEVKRWVQVIDASSQQAASLNREIRKLLRFLNR
jgi:signal transduction histidine kinase